VLRERQSVDAITQLRSLLVTTPGSGPSPRQRRLLEATLAASSDGNESRPASQFSRRTAEKLVGKPYVGMTTDGSGISPRNPTSTTTTAQGRGAVSQRHVGVSRRSGNGAGGGSAFRGMRAVAPGMWVRQPTAD
jgi:hypothetical protein